MGALVAAKCIASDCCGTDSPAISTNTDNESIQNKNGYKNLLEPQNVSSNQIDEQRHQEEEDYVTDTGYENDDEKDSDNDDEEEQDDDDDYDDDDDDGDYDESQLEFTNNYDPLFEFMSNHEVIVVSKDGWSATNRSGNGTASIMFGKSFPYNNNNNNNDNSNNIYTFDIKINDCGCDDNIGISIVPKQFDCSRNSPYKHPGSYTFYSDGVYDDWDHQTHHVDNEFTFHKTGTRLRVKVDMLKEEILIKNVYRTKQHIIKLHSQYSKNGENKQFRFAFILYSGGNQENSKITVLNQEWK